MIDGLSREVGPIGIKTLTLNVGGFRSQVNTVQKRHWPSTEHNKELMGFIDQALDYVTNNPLGDPEKIANVIVDLVKGEGVGEGKELSAKFPGATDSLVSEYDSFGPNDIPMSLPLGSDSIDILRARCEMTLRVLKQWEGVIKSTDYALKE